MTRGLPGWLLLASILAVSACGKAVPEPLTPSTAGTEARRRTWKLPGRILAGEMPRFSTSWRCTARARSRLRPARLSAICLITCHCWEPVMIYCMGCRFRSSRLLITGTNSGAY